MVVQFACLFHVIAFIGPSRSGKSFIASALSSLLGVGMDGLHFRHSSRAGPCTVGMDYLLFRVRLQESNLDGSPKWMAILVLDVEGGEATGEADRVRHAKLCSLALRISSWIVYTSRNHAFRQSFSEIETAFAQMAAIGASSLLPFKPSLFLINTPSAEPLSGAMAEDFLQQMMASPHSQVRPIPLMNSSKQTKYSSDNVCCLSSSFPGHFENF